MAYYLAGSSSSDATSNSNSNSNSKKNGATAACGGGMVALCHHDEDALGKKESSKNVLAMLGDLQHKVRLSNIMTCVCHRLMFLCFSFLLS